MKVNPENYDYIMYVDASGDDGFKFGQGSSICYAAAALLVKRDDITHNMEILDRIKKSLGCKLNDEVKYSRVRRHRHADVALASLGELRGRLSSYVMFKKEVDKEKYIGTKAMSIVCHLMALRSIDFYHFPDGCNVLIAIDRMKQTEEAPIEHLINKENAHNAARGFNVDVIFRDSKDPNFLLIQIADLLCGAIREHFEQYENHKEMIYFGQKCPMCQKLRAIKRRNTYPLCKSGNSRTQKIFNSQNFRYILPLFPATSSIDMFDYFFIDPVHMMDRHFYMICRRKK